MKKTTIGILIGIATLGATTSLALSSAIIAPASTAHAASISDCLSSSGADKVASVQRACSSCSGGARGTLWFNGSAVDKNSDEVVSDTNATTLTIYMWGQVFSCQQSTTRTNIAMHIWLGDAGQMSDPSQRLSYFTNVPSSLNRGTGIGQPYTWYSPSNNNAPVTVDVQGFIADADSHETIMEGDTTYEVYKKTVSVNRCFSNAYGAYVYDGSVCYGDDSVITLRLKKVDPPEPEPEPEYGSGDAYFESETKATVSGLSDGPTMSTTSPRDGYSELKFSTDDDYVNIDFSHTMFYINNGSYDAKDTFPTVSTNWTVSTSGSGSNGYSTSGTYSTYGKNSSSSQVNSNTVRISLSPGETKEVCQSINYRPKYISFGRIEHEKRIGRWPNYRWVHDYWEYFESGSSGSNYSKVCVEVTRPADPTGSPMSSGTMNNTLMYTGETAEIGWSVSGTSYPTRRLAQWEAIVYQVPVTVGYRNDITEGGSRYRGGGTCAYYNGKSSTRYCGVFNSQSGSTGYGDTMAYHHATSPPAFNVAVPDYVGDKYCNSFGYRYEYWYYTTEQGWQRYPSSDYWYIYNSTCRTIAKKPSMATWNNSILTNGGVQTSISPRHVPANMGDLASKSRTLYGSWTEYLNVIGGTVDGLTSGAALALGSSYQEVYSNSPLTIANNTTNLGSSGVQSSTALRTRLDTYLKNQGATDPGDTIGGSGWTDRTGTSIYHRQGDLNITGNITLSAGNYDNIYQLPQIVIFVDGNVNISSNVTQIDAWIIASSSSTINTCSDFQVGVTEADAVGRSSNTCTNQLVFNGPVMAGRLALNRSFGSDPLISYRKGTFGANSDRQTPAEVFNYRADAYLWAYAQAGRYESSYTETYTRELAPRY